MLCLAGTPGPSETCEHKSNSFSQPKVMCIWVCVSLIVVVCQFIHMRVCLCCLPVWRLLEKSWSRVNIVWNVNCLHDNSPVSSFRLSSVGCVPKQPNQVCHGINPLIDLSYLKIHLFIYADFCTMSPLTLSGLSPQCAYAETKVCVCVCRSNSAASWQQFGRFSNRTDEMFCILFVALLCMSVFVTEQCLGKWWTMQSCASVFWAA